MRCPLVPLLAVGCFCGLHTPSTWVQPAARWAYAGRPHSAHAAGRHCGSSACRASDDEGIKASPCSTPLPLGPLCIFQSEFWSGLARDDNYAEDLERKQKVVAGLMMKMQMGQRLEREEQVQMRTEMRQANEMWLAKNLRMRYAEDFQASESFKFAEALFLRDGFSMDMMEALVSWQSNDVEAVMERRPRPPMPAGLDPQKMQSVQPRMSLLNAMLSPPQLTTPPFSSGDLDSPVVREELEALMRDHQQIINFGKGYRSFDPRGKEAFLNQIELIQDRWKVFFARFQLMGKLNQAYVAESEAYLQRLSLSAADFGTVLAEAHSLMRAEAESEGQTR